MMYKHKSIISYICTKYYDYRNEEFACTLKFQCVKHMPLLTISTLVMSGHGLKTSRDLTGTPSNGRSDPVYMYS